MAGCAAGGLESISDASSSFCRGVSRLWDEINASDLSGDVEDGALARVEERTVCRCRVRMRDACRSRRTFHDRDGSDGGIHGLAAEPEDVVAGLERAGQRCAVLGTLFGRRAFPVHRASATMDDQDKVQIGRASCRERVSPYV